MRRAYDSDPRVRRLKAQLDQTVDPQLRQLIWDQLEDIAEDYLTGEEDTSWH